MFAECVCLDLNDEREKRIDSKALHNCKESITKMDCKSNKPLELLIKFAMWDIRNDSLLVFDNFKNIRVFEKDLSSSGMSKYTQISILKLSGLSENNLRRIMLVDDVMKIIFSSGLIQFLSWPKIIRKNVQNVNVYDKVNVEKKIITADLTSNKKYIICVTYSGQAIRITIPEKVQGFNQTIDLNHENIYRTQNNCFDIQSLILPGINPHEKLIFVTRQGEINIWDESCKNLAESGIASVLVRETIASFLVLKSLALFVVGTNSGNVHFYQLSQTEDQVSLFPLYQEKVSEMSIDLLSFQEEHDLLAVCSGKLRKILIICVKSLLKGEKSSFEIPLESEIKLITWKSNDKLIPTIVVVCKNGWLFFIDCNLKAFDCKIDKVILDGIFHLESIAFNPSRCLLNQFFAVDNETSKIYTFDIPRSSRENNCQSIKATHTILGNSNPNSCVITCQRAELFLVGTRGGEILVYKYERDTRLPPSLVQHVSVHTKPIQSLMLNAEGSFVFSKCVELVVAHKLDNSNLQQLPKVNIVNENNVSIDIFRIFSILTNNLLF